MELLNIRSVVCNIINVAVVPYVWRYESQSTATCHAARLQEIVLLFMRMGQSRKK
jgi:hypothetical protein